MATHSSILAWRIPWTEEPGGLQSIGLQRVRHNWSNLAHTHNFIIMLWSQEIWGLQLYSFSRLLCQFGVPEIFICILGFFFFYSWRDSEQYNIKIQVLTYSDECFLNLLAYPSKEIWLLYAATQLPLLTFLTFTSSHQSRFTSSFKRSQALIIHTNVGLV